MLVRQGGGVNCTGSRATAKHGPRAAVGVDECKPLVRPVPEPLAVPCAVNQVWSMDFMHDQPPDERGIRLFNVIDDVNREALGIDVYSTHFSTDEWHACPSAICLSPSPP
ncbi:hypothetical protein PI86_09675 [Burkholderia sp. A9]|nr:hypothetical protein PI86_09675 [Burkholderia sp. A9]